MKSELTLLTTIVVFGFCSGMVTYKRDTEYYFTISPEKSMKNLMNLDENSLVEGEQVLLNTAKEFRDYVAKKVSHVYALLQGRKNRDEVNKAMIMRLDELPMFQEPFEIGNLFKNYKLAYMNFTNIKVHGMSGFNQSLLLINTKDKTVKLIMEVDSLTIEGEYSLSNILKQTSGAFNVKINKVNYTETDVYELTSNDVDVVSGQATMRYDNAAEYFENIGFFAQVFEGVITDQLMQDVIPKIGQEVGHLMRTPILTKTRIAVGFDTDKMLNGIEQLIKSAISETRNFLRKGYYSDVELEDEPVHVQSNGISGQILNVHLSGVRTFQVHQMEVQIEDNKFRINVSATTGPLSGYANMMVYYRDNEPWSVSYTMDDMKVSIILEKELYNDNDVFKIVKLNVQTQKLQTQTNISHPEPLELFFKNEMPKYLEPIINTRVARFIKESIMNVLNVVEIKDNQVRLKTTGEH